MNINEMVKAAHENAVAHGFYENENRDYNIKEKLLLIHAEISEACEADRKNRHFDKKMFDKWQCGIKQNKNITQISDSDFEWLVKDTFEDELADAVIRIFDLAGYCDIDLESHITAKMQYNKNRPYKHGKEY